MAESEEITPEEYKEFNDAFDRYFDAQGRHAALQSQGKYCPPGIVKRAELEMMSAWKSYERTKVFKLRGRGKRCTVIFNRFAIINHNLRELVQRLRHDT